jgi:hypothetical protein
MAPGSTGEVIVRHSWRNLGAATASMALASCAVVSPLIDRDMSKAPNSACGRPAEAAPSNEQCFIFAEEDSSGARQRWQGGRLTPGRTLVAVYRAGPHCAGTFTHLTVTGASDGPGRATLSVWDALGRAGHSHEVRWHEAFAERRLTLASIASATMNPGGARVRVTEGSFDPGSLCFQSY